MAAPHVAGGAALLRALHPGWTVEQVKSALVSTGRPVWADGTRSTEAEATRSGGGMIQLEQAADPLVFATPQSVAFGLLDAHSPASALGVCRPRRRGRRRRSVDGHGRDAERAGRRSSWTCRPRSPCRERSRSACTSPANAPEGERTGFVVLTRGAERRRIPFWYRVTRPRLPEAAAVTLDGPGTYRGNAAQGAAMVSTYRYPDGPSLVRRVLPGPEQVFRIVLRRAAANLGVSVIGAAPGVAVHPRIVLGADENRLAGASALPYVGNPYLTSFLAQSTSVAVLLPEPGHLLGRLRHDERRASGPRSGSGSGSTTCGHRPSRCCRARPRVDVSVHGCATPAPASIRARSCTAWTAARGARAAWQATSRRCPSPSPGRGRTGSSYACPIGRRRRTTRTSRASSRTRASSWRRSACHG